MNAATSPDLFREFAPQPHRARPPITRSTGAFEWFTPARYVEAARRALGGIDLDPASCDIAQEVVAARAYYTKEIDGLRQPWRGTTWLNPPYRSDLIGQFVGRLIEHVRTGDVPAAIMLVDNRTDTRWFHAAAEACSAICFPRGRLRFLRPGGEPGSPTNGSVFFYFGNDRSAFEREFQPFGLLQEVVRTWADPQRGMFAGVRS